MDIILLEPEHEGNVGAVCRVMANFEFCKLTIVNPKCNLESDEFVRRAKHSKGKVKIRAVKKLPKYDLLIGTTSKIFTDYNIARSPINPEQLTDKIKQIKNKSGKIGLLFGREGIGLTNEEIKKCNLLVSINTSKKYPAMNLSHAIAVVLYELSKKSKNRKITDQIELAKGKELKQINKMMNNIINRSDFSTKEKKNIQKTIWKNMFNRALLSKREAFGVMGLLNKINKKK